MTNRRPAFDRPVRALESALGFAAAALIFTVMVIVCVDVALRYIFNDPLSWAYDLVSLYVMVGLLYLTLGPSYAEDHHIRIDILARKAGTRGALWLNRLQIVLILPVICIIAYLAMLEGWSAYSAGRVLSGPIPWPRWPISALVCAGCLVLMLRLAMQWVTGPEPHEHLSEGEL